MSYVGKQVNVNETNFLASSKFVSFQQLVDNTNAAVVTDELGHKVIPAGSILPANDATAKGISTDEVDVTDGKALVGLIVEGWVYGKRLPVAPSADAIKAMTAIHFKDADTTPAAASTPASTTTASASGSSTTGTGSSTTGTSSTGSSK